MVWAMGYQAEWVQVLTSDFMRNALIGGTFVALAAGLIGYFTIVRQSTFAAHALAHIGLPGATGAVVIGVPATVGLGVFCIAGGLAIGALGKRAAEREIATGTVLALATAFGLFFSSLAAQNAARITNVLFGNLLAITDGQLVAFAVLLAALAVTVGVIYRPLLFASVNAAVAEARGVPVRLLSVVFMVLLALAVTMAVQVVGTLLLFALLVTPAATAVMLTAQPSWAIAAATVIALLSVWVGLLLSAMFGVPPSFAIATLPCVLWLVVWAVERLRTSRAVPA